MKTPSEQHTHINKHFLSGGCFHALRHIGGCFFRGATLTFIVLISSAGWLNAQDDTVPLVQDVRSLQVRLKMIGQEVTVKYAVDGNRIFYFPVFLLEEAKLLGGIPFTDVQGNLRIPSGDGPLNLTVTLLDLWKSRAYQDDLICTLTNHPVIRSLTPVPQLLPSATTGQRLVNLILTDPNFGNQRVVLAESLLSDLADAQHRVNAQFLLDRSDLTTLRGFAGGLPILAQHLAVQVEQSFRARFTTNLAQVNLQSAVHSLAEMHQSLLPVPDRRQPTLLLSPNLPINTPQGGSVVQDKHFTDQIKRFVRLQILTRAGANVDAQLVDRLVEAALAQAPLALQISDAERQNAVASLLLDDGLTISLALNEINNLDVALHSNQESEFRSALVKAATKSQHTEVHGSAGVSIGPFGGSASVDTLQKWSRSDYVNSKMEDIKRQVRDANVRLSGTVRTMTGIRFSQSGAVENISFTSIQQSIDTYTVGDATILNIRSINEYAAKLGQAAQVEALLVPQTLADEVNAFFSDQWPRDGEGRVKDVEVQFSQPFAEPPKVVTGFRMLDLSNGANTRVGVYALNVTHDRFTLRIMTWADSYVFGCSASWIATGRAQIAAVAPIPIGQAGVAKITESDRLAVRMPLIDSTAPIVNGGLQFGFNTIPGRTYELQSSTNLVNWSSIGSATAKDFNLLLATGDNFAWPHRFFRVMTP